MKLLGTTKDTINKEKNGENMSCLEITEIILAHRNIANSYYQHNLRVLYTFVPNKSFVQLLDISPENSIFLKTFFSEFSCIEVWFTGQSS